MSGLWRDDPLGRRHTDRGRTAPDCSSGREGAVKQTRHNWTLCSGGQEVSCLDRSMDQTPPRTIFKYRALGGEFGRQAIEEALLHSQLYWQSPSSFNDPFDCQPFFVFGSNDKQRARYARSLTNRVMAGETRKARLLKAKSLAKTSQKRARLIAQNVVDRAVVTCFSSENDNPLMWAHYAANHTGVCLIFQESLNPPFLSFAVSYSEVNRAGSAGGVWL